MIAEQLQHVLESTSYLLSGRRCAHGVRIGADAQAQRRGQGFRPDARWEGQASLRVYFKYVEDDVPSETIGTWRRELWNERQSPLLWIVSPQRTVIYNAFGRPQRRGDATANRLKTFGNTASELERLDSFAGHLAMETGQFWRNEPNVNLATGVEQQLLSDLDALERDLVAEGLPRHDSQALIGRCICMRYLIDRRIVGSNLLQSVCGQPSLPLALGDATATRRLFAWLTRTFNGDMFPMDSVVTTPARPYLDRVAQFLGAIDPSSGQQSLFPYQFDVLPAEIISSIYDQFARPGADAESGATDRHGVHCTRRSPVALVLDEVLHEARGSESLLDPACGSGVYSVGALRRLVRLRSKGAEPTRDIIRSTLHEQVFGIDTSETAVRVAAFSLYLAALEIDPDPTSPDALTFKPLIGTSLFVGAANKIGSDEQRPPGLTGPDGRTRTFDVIVGSSPRDFKGKTGTGARQPREAEADTHSPHGESLEFVEEARKFAHDETRFGLILSALPFFSGRGTGPSATHSLLQSLAPVTLVNLSNLRSWLFPNTKEPAAALFARHRPQQRRERLTVVKVPWSESGARTHTLAVAPQDALTIPLSSVQRGPELFKAAAFGRHHDLWLLDRLKNRHRTLRDQLEVLGTKLSQDPPCGGFVPKTMIHLTLPTLDRANSKGFAAGTNILPSAPQPAERPGTPSTDQAPLLLVKNSLKLTSGPRLVVSVTDPAMASAMGCVGAVLRSEDRPTAHLLAGILSSALASWYFLMTSSTAGLRTGRLLVSEFNRFPVPDLRSAVGSADGRRVLEIARALQQCPPGENGWNELDEAVFALFGLGNTERIVVQDGLAQAGWMWQRSQRESVAPAGIKELEVYARAFLRTMDAWFSARNVRRMRAEILEVPASAPLRVVRFALEERPGPSILETVPVEGGMSAVLTRTGERLGVRIADSLAHIRELRVHGPEEVVIIKPSARRHWMGVPALEDANALVAKSFSGAGI